MDFCVSWSDSAVLVRLSFRSVTSLWVVATTCCCAVTEPGFFQARVVAPILAQLKQGITPEKIALTLALVGMGLDFAPALIGVIIYRLFNFWLPIVPALFLIPAIRDLRHRLRRAERAPVS